MRKLFTLSEEFEGYGIIGIVGSHFVLKEGAEYKGGLLDLNGKNPVWLSGYEILEAGENRIAVSKNGLCGFLDENGREVIPPQYEYVFRFSEGMAVVQQNGEYGAIDMAGNLVVPTEYELIKRGYSDGLAVAQKGGLYGYLDKNGGVAIPFRYQTVGGAFGNGIANVGKFGDFEFIDHTGAPVAALNALRNSIDDISGFSEGLAVAKKGGKYGMIDLNGQTVIPFQYDELEPCINGIIVSHIKPSSNSLPSGSRILDKTGKIVFTSDADVLFRLGKSNYFFSRTDRTVYSVTP